MAAATDASRAPRIDSFITAARPVGSGWSDAVPRKLGSSSSPTRFLFINLSALVLRTVRLCNWF